MKFLSLLRQRHLAILWLSQVFSSVGDHLYTIAVTWTAVQLAGGEAGLVVAAGSATRLVFGLLGGVFADRWDRRTTLIAVDLARGAAVAVLPVLASTVGLQLWHLAAAAVVINGLSALFDPALQASLPALLPDRHLLPAINGLMDGTRRLALALGPSLAGWLVAYLPLPQFFTLDTITFLTSALAIAAIGRHFAPRPSRDHSARRGIVAEIAEAIRLTAAQPILAWFIATNTVSNVAWAPAFQVGTALFASQRLGADVGAYGFIVGAYGAGNIVSNLVIGSLAARRPEQMLVAARFVMALGFGILALAPNLAVTMLGSAVAAVGGPMGDIVLLTVLHESLPADQIGKVYALRLTGSSIGMSLGLLLAGPLFGALPVNVAIGLCAAGIGIIGVAAWLRFRGGAAAQNAVS